MKTVQVRVDDGVYEGMVRAAQMEGRTLSGWLRWVIGLRVAENPWRQIQTPLMVDENPRVPEVTIIAPPPETLKPVPDVQVIGHLPPGPVTEESVAEAIRRGPIGLDPIGAPMSRPAPKPNRPQSKTLPPRTNRDIDEPLDEHGKITSQPPDPPRYHLRPWSCPKCTRLQGQVKVCKPGCQCSCHTEEKP